MRSLSTRHTGSHQWHALFWPGITCWAARAFGGHAPWQLELPQVLWARPGALWGRRWGATDLVPACHVRLAFLIHMFEQLRMLDACCIVQGTSYCPEGICSECMPPAWAEAAEKQLVHTSPPPWSTWVRVTAWLLGSPMEFRDWADCALPSLSSSFTMITWTCNFSFFLEM